MLRVTLLVPRERSGDLATALQRLKLVHVDPAAKLDSEEQLEQLSASAQQAENKLKQLALIHGVFDELAPLKKGFAASLVAVPMRVTGTDMREAVTSLDVEALYDQCLRLGEQYRRYVRQLEEAEEEEADLSFFARLPFDVAVAQSFRHVRVWVGALSEARWAALRADAWAGEHVAFEVLQRAERAVWVCAVALTAEAEECAEVLKKQGFVERPLPGSGPAISDRLAQLRERMEEMRRHRERCRAAGAKLAAHRRDAAMVDGYWRGELARLRAVTSGAATKRISVFTGYVRARESRALEDGLRKSIPEASVVFEKPKPGEAVPVSLRLGPVLKPMSFLVDMFGRPDYFSFDPTPYLTFSFLLFFGFCFGDVVYGAMLCAVSGFLAWKARHYEGLRNLCVLFLYAGLATIVFGALTGSWAADLWKPEYLGRNNVLMRLQQRLVLVDPLEKPVLMLLVSLGIGVCSQFYGIALKGCGLLRRGQAAAALFDAGLWLLMLPGFMVVFGALFFPEPRWLFRTGVGLMLFAGLGLVMTQGRHEKTLAGKAITGLVSLYGIMGSYGCLSFLGDTLSYSRLLALGLTTTIIGMSFNIMAGLLKQVPVVGIGLFVALLVLGHMFNFAVSIIGSFVHPARLIFLEFFSRFYESGGTKFTPLSADNERVLVSES
jgi:V/A-type H+-transporting ATPase subunit I